MPIGGPPVVAVVVVFEVTADQESIPQSLFLKSLNKIDRVLEVDTPQGTHTRLISPGNDTLLTVQTDSPVQASSVKPFYRFTFVAVFASTSVVRQGYTSSDWG